MHVSGTITPMITPTTGELNVDTESLQEFTEFLTRSGVDGLIPTGTTGEFTSLGRDQRRTVIGTVVEHSANRPVLAGCGGTAVQSVRHYINDAADVGADAAVVVTPYYQDTTHESVVRFYEAVAANSPLPIYLYNIPQFTGNHLKPKTVVQLADHPNIVGIKDSSGDFNLFMDFLDKTPRSFDVVQGIPTYSLLSLEHGADGLIAGPSNVFPQAVSELYDAYENGNDDRARERLSGVLLPILQSTQSMPMVSALRHLSAKAGRDLGDPLPPLPDLTPRQRDKLDDCFQTITTTKLNTTGD